VDEGAEDERLWLLGGQRRERGSGILLGRRGMRGCCFLTFGRAVKWGNGITVDEKG
jgi:hypothetical protein